MARLPLPPAEPMKLIHLAEIAKGGMGSVELARVEGGRFHGGALAIKRLHANVASDPQFVGMFLDEAWMTAALKSPNVVQVAAWGNDEQGMFLAVELVEGVSLSRLIKEARQNKEPFAERSAAFVASQICAGMAAAHGLRGPDGALLGLVHRDLTPGNILVSFEGVVKIADFGIAKAEERITHTRTGTLKGKPAYMAPEQARGGKVDARADIFSFGVMLFEMLAGRRPWTAKAAFDVMMEAATSPAPDLGSIRKGCNPMLVEIVHKCLEKKPEDRFANAGEIQARLDAWRTQRGFAADDAQSLGQFVRRNSSQQIRWFEQALRGDFVRKAAPTFKELEEGIDEARERQEPRSPRPAAGRAAPGDPRPASGQYPAAGSGAYPAAGSGPYPAVASGSGQYPAATRGSGPYPAAGSGQYPAAGAPPPDPPEPPLDAATIAYDPGPKRKSVKLDAALISPLTSPLAKLPLPALGDAARPAPGARPATDAKALRALGGTELMRTNPIHAAGLSGLGLPPPQPGRDVRIGATPADAARASQPDAPASRTAPGLTQTVDEPPTTPAPAQRRPSLAGANAAVPVVPRRPTSRAGAILLLLALPLVGFGVVAAWRYRDRLLGGSGPAATTAPPGTGAPTGAEPAPSAK